MEVPRRLEHTYQVRFDEADAQGHLRPSGFLRFAQDMAWRHSELAGFGREWYAERQLTWLVRDVELVVVAPVTYADVLAVTTEVVGWRHVWARRHAEVRRRSAGGDRPAPLAASIDTDWVLLTEDGRPARVPEEIGRLFGSHRTFERHRQALPLAPPDAPHLTTRVRPLDVDPMGHMNNAAYLDIVEEAAALLPPISGLTRASTAAPSSDGGGAGRRWRVGYLRAALPGMQLDVSCWRPSPATVACRIADSTGCELARALIGRAEQPE